MYDCMAVTSSLFSFAFTNMLVVSMVVFGGKIGNSIDGFVVIIGFAEVSPVTCFVGVGDCVLFFLSMFSVSSSDVISRS